ncbi:MAG: hypothetical protein HYU69_01135 [Bacteroidetes bacterium]|nr:hypothetical protein [Bacteroidota bacterium]
MKQICLSNAKSNEGIRRVSLYNTFFTKCIRPKNEFGILLLVVHFTFQFFSNAVFAQAPGEWTWMHGLTTFDSPGVFGTKGVPNPANMPPALYEPAGEWKDSAGNLYFFGGLGLGYYSDVWKYDVSTNQWTWINGPGIPDQLGVYGTQGIPAAANYPGGRAYASLTWVDNAGNFWLFGGTGYNAVSAGNMMNELWKYNVATNQWAWMGGPNNINNSPGSYGTMGVASPTNMPPARAECSASWVDNAGNLWFYGGNGGINKRFGDMWKYDVTTNQWTWMSGSNIFNAPAVYGTLNVPAAANTPGGRWTYASWTDLTGKFWLFGGTLGSLVTNQNDMWLYDPAINQWTWKGGNAAANYGTKCVPAATNLPPKKYEMVMS